MGSSEGLPRERASALPVTVRGSTQRRVDRIGTQGPGSAFRIPLPKREDSEFKSQFCYQSCVVVGKWLDLSGAPFPDLEEGNDRGVDWAWEQWPRAFQHT